MLERALGVRIGCISSLPPPDAQRTCRPVKHGLSGREFLANPAHKKELPP